MCAINTIVSFWNFDINSPAAPKSFADFAERSTDIDFSNCRTYGPLVFLFAM